MANRVLLDQNGLKVSMPGRNVLTDSNVDLLFTSDWPTLGVVEQGTQVVSWGGGNSGSYDQSVYFDRPFSSIPSMQVALRIDGGGRSISSGGNVIIERNVLQEISGALGSIAYYRLRSIAYADRVRFLGEFTRNSGSYIIPTLTIDWKVFAYSY